MRLFNVLCSLLVLGFVASCGLADPGLGYDSGEFDGGDSGDSGGCSGGQGQAGVITAGEWNDLDNWDFWTDLIDSQTYGNMPSVWKFDTRGRICVHVSDESGNPVANAKVGLKKTGHDYFLCEARTDNRGVAEMWDNLFFRAMTDDAAPLKLIVNDVESTKPVLTYDQGINYITASHTVTANRIEVAFMVDATGSMSDELEFLKTELVNVIGRVESDNAGATVMTASVFYRDEGDDYLTRISDFTADVNVTSDFVRQQRAEGGGDYPEAVHTALNEAVGQLQWSSDAKTRLMFLILDAPPHYRGDVIDSLHESIEDAMCKGIKIIPVSASGVNKETEFLMRFFAVSTGGTYVFITDDSGVGNQHLEASVGEYQVEYLNDLMIRLINKYSE